MDNIKIKVKTVNNDEQFFVKFTSTQQYNKIYTTLMEQKARGPNEFITIDNGDSKADIHTDSIQFFSFPEENITWQQDHMMMLSLVFEDKQRFFILILGTKRGRHAYDQVRVLLEKEPTNFCISILQEENKRTLVKHYAKIKEIYLNEYTVNEFNKGSING